MNKAPQQRIAVAKYKAKFKALGFHRVEVWVPEHTKQAIRDLAAELRGD